MSLNSLGCTGGKNHSPLLSFSSTFLSLLENDFTCVFALVSSQTECKSFLICRNFWLSALYYVLEWLWCIPLFISSFFFFFVISMACRKTGRSKHIFLDCHFYLKAADYFCKLTPIKFRLQKITRNWNLWTCSVLLLQKSLKTISCVFLKV